MCNSLHSDSKPIKENGYGYKVFTVKDNKFYQMRSNSQLYFPALDGWIKWEKDDFSGDGFCFFLQKREAGRLLKRWSSAFYDDSFVVKRIQYRKGMGIHIEDNIVKKFKFKTALCREFRILEGL
jgi:hypothetical protein